jgi:hypothetical protein
MLIEWIDRTINEIPIDTLPDEQVVICKLVNSSKGLLAIYKLEIVKGCLMHRKLRN